MVVSLSDHPINDDKLFQETVVAAAKLADKKNGIVTIEITPTFPVTGFGYVQTTKDITGNNKIKQFKVKQFVEKPVKATAESYLNKDRFYCNSGLFVFKVSVFLEAVKEFAPELFYDLKKNQADTSNSSFDQTLDTIYTKNLYIHSGNGIIALLGLDDVIDVQEGDATLVCKRDNTENINKVVRLLKEQDMIKYI